MLADFRGVIRALSQGFKTLERKEENPVLLSELLPYAITV
jgi:hypothetical protein